MELNITAYSEYIKKAAEILPKGAFLTTKHNDKINTMTIGWGTFGFQWGTPTAEVMVRESRFTKELIDKSMEFTLTFPYDESMKAALSYCGQKSGRDYDKIADMGLLMVDAKETNTPVVACKGLALECKIIAKTEMKADLTDSSVLDKWYKNGDLHTIYYAKVVACYELD